MTRHRGQSTRQCQLHYLPSVRSNLTLSEVTDGIVLLVRGVLFTKNALATKRHSKRQDSTISAPMVWTDEPRGTTPPSSARNWGRL